MAQGRVDHRWHGALRSRLSDAADNTDDGPPALPAGAGPVGDPFSHGVLIGKVLFGGVTIGSGFALRTVDQDGGDRVQTYRRGLIARTSAPGS